MRRRLIPIVVFLAATLAVSASTANKPARTSAVDPNRLVVHEWGTFTSVAGVNGTAIEWTPLLASADLPCFVDKVAMGPKASLPALVRMETPVLYFYTQQDTTVDVRVRFRQGAITEWYPRADVSPMKLDPQVLRNPSLVGRIDWNGVKVRPRADESYPVEPGENHYYAARATDAAPLQVGHQREKLLFYRGVGMFAPPVAAWIAADGQVVLQSNSGRRIGDVALFENRRGIISYRLLNAGGTNVTLPFPSAPASLAGLRASLVRLLESHGLYEPEAKAMVETWRDSWFEEGTRIFYLAPREVVDEILPLEISPAPAATERLFVGRIELLRKEAVEEIRTAILQRNAGPIARRGRFVLPLLDRIAEVDQRSHNAVLRDLAWVYAAAVRPAPSCR